MCHLLLAICSILITAHACHSNNGGMETGALQEQMKGGPCGTVRTSHGPQRKQEQQQKHLTHVVNNGNSGDYLCVITSTPRGLLSCLSDSMFGP